MNERGNIQSLLVLRKLTRTMASDLRAHLLEHLTALTPVLRPETVFGKLIQGGHKDWVVKGDQAQRELMALYEKIAPAAPFHLRTELVPPFDIGGLSLDITPVEYTHVAHGEAGPRKIVVRCPLAWTLSYKGFAVPALKQLLAARTRPPADLQRILLSYLALHLVTQMQPSVMKLLTSLRFPVTTATDPELGALPLTRIAVEVGTERPSDAVIIESAEVTGMDAFEEVVRLEDIQRLRDPLREQLFETIAEQAPELLPR